MSVRKGNRSGRNEVRLAHLGRIETAFVGHQVHQPLEIERRLRTTRAAIGAVGHRVGVGADDLVIDVLDQVGTGRHDPGAPRQIERLRIGAGIEQHPRLERDDLAVLVRADLELAPLVAAMIGRQEILGAGLDPLHRSVVLEGQRRDDEVLAIGADLDAEAAADFGRDAAHLVLAQTERIGDRIAIPVRSLGGAPEGDPARDRIGHRQHGASLHRHGMTARLADLHLDLDGRRCQGALRIAVHARLAHADVVLDLGIELRCAVLDRLVRIDDRGELLVVDLHQLGGILRGFDRIGDHDGDRIADVAHLAGRQRLHLGHVDLAVADLVLSYISNWVSPAGSIA